MLVAINILILLLIAVWLWRRDTSVLHKFYWPALITKCVAGLSLGIIYSTYYEASDTFTFFQLAVDQADLARNDLGAYLGFLFSKREGYFLGEHRTIFFTKITSVLALLTGNNYWITSLYFSLLSFFAAWYLSNTIARLFPEYKIAACITFLFFPSVVFWSSGIIKEALAMAAMFFLTASFLRLWVREQISILAILLAVICGLTVFNLKYYYLAVFIPVTVSALIAQRLCEKFKIESSLKQILIMTGVLSCGFLAITFLHPNFSPSRILEVIAFNNKAFMDACTPDDVIHFYNLEPTWGSMVINAPWAFISGLFRPFVWEANTIFKFITGAENLVLLLLTIFAIPHLKNIPRSPHRLLLVGVILYCATLSIFLALSTPNFGTLARYGVGYLPFVALLVFHQPAIAKAFSKLF
jgi:uncharacterized membrane protein YiaA